MRRTYTHAMSQGDQDRAESPGGVQSVDRAISVLEILARRGSAGVSEVAEEIGVHKSTAFRLLGALEDRGLVEQASDRGKYQLGFGILRLASAIPRRLDLVRQGRPVLDELATAFGETVNLAVIRSHYAVNVDQAVGSAAVAAQNWVGQLTPLHATSSGKVLLAHQTPRSPQAAARRGQAGPLHRPHADQPPRARPAAGRRRSATATPRRSRSTRTGSTRSPPRCATTPARSSAAVSVSGPAYRLDQERIAGLVDDLKAGVDQITERMGFL